MCNKFPPKSVLAHHCLASKIGFALPLLLAGHSLIAISYGLFSTLQPGTGKAAWIGYQIMAGIGRGMALQMVTF